MKALIRIFIFCFIFVAEVKSQAIIQVNGNVTVEGEGNQYSLRMNENNHDFDDGSDPYVPLFGATGATLTPYLSFVSGTFEYDVALNDDEYIVYATQSFDYESNDRIFIFNVHLTDDSRPLITLNINNIDDESPTLTPPTCTFDENTIYTAQNSSCFCTVSDADGWLNNMTFTIVNNTRDEPYIFALEYRETPGDEVYSADVYVTVREELNYQNITFYLFDIRAEDGAGHSTTPNPLVRATINVNDLPDTPPQWTSFFQAQRFEEKSDQTFSVTAIDGDYGLNYEINYSVLWEDSDDEYISIDNNGTITVRGIDRDKDDILTYNFEIMAFEVPDAPLWNNTLNITFYIDDIDDNPPLVNWIMDAERENVTFSENDEKFTNMSFLENFAGTLNLTIYIRDRDTGENAQFSVELEDLPENDVAYTEAFFIVPTAGYREGEFTISVRNATYLDYEVPEWVHISFNVLTRGTLDPTKEDRLLVNIELIDYNDEIPVFQETEYVVYINETEKKDEIIIKIQATDRDAEDAELNHTLIGSSYTSRVLAIRSVSGEIYVNADNAFDYDTVNPIFVQVRATDHANHTATVPLTINLIDVNNKAPTISVGEPIDVDENQNVSAVLNSTITASDMDTTANLTADIDWDRSYVMKNSRRLDMTNVTIRQQVEFLNVEYEPLSDDEDERDISIKLIVNDNNPDGTTPDFELFDSLYIMLVVTDWNTDPEFLANQNTSALILISINDLNDNTPYFPEADLPEDERDNRTVQENVSKGTSVGSIVAIDLDVDDTVTYNCTALDSYFDWLELNPDTGAFTVKNDSIDADTYKTFYFNYSCTASDGVHTSDPLVVRFYIIDTNSREPEITINSTLYVDEKSDPDTNVTDGEIGTYDMDRDIPFHTVACNLDRDTDCADQFIILDNVIQVRVGGTAINRDRGPANYTCPMTCQDNPDRLQNDRNQHTAQRTFIIVLNDINDHTPEVLTHNFLASESAMEGDTIGIILATDIDEGLNAEIDFTLQSVENENGDDLTDLFGIVTDENYEVNATHKQANLIALKDLIGWYGSYNLGIVVADQGDPPNVASVTYATLVIDKFNFEPPRFVFPSSNGTSFLLLASQQEYSPLILFRSEDSNVLPDFYASDNSESDTCSKWDITIDVEQISPEDAVTIFEIAKTAQECTGQLQVNRYFDPDTVLGTPYILTLTATVREGEPLEGEAPYTTSTTITINFLDNSQKPVFNCHEMEFEFIEEKLDQTKDLTCTASYEIEDDTLQIFYYLDPTTTDETIENTFKVDSSTGMISLKQVISYKTNVEFKFSIVASNDTSPTSYNPNSFLNVTCTVIEINNNSPQWTRQSFFGAIMSGFIQGTPILVVEATDADTIDQGYLTYHINGTINSSGNGLNNVPENAFVVIESTGEVRLNFQVDSTMSGYFQFKVTVQDRQDQFGNGPFSNTTTVTIVIITQDNTVSFRFFNTVDEVQNEEDEMLNVVSEVLEYDAYKQNIDKETENGVELNDTTIATLYFINSSDTVEAVTASRILRLVSNVNTFSQLVGQMRNRTGLVLLSFPSSSSSSENLEEVLKAWLVGVSVVLGALCLILLVTFILKTRELNNRIKKLTTNKFGSQESGLNRLGISAPTTNKHAIEGSNPIFNLNSNDINKEDLGRYDDFDRNSIRSGDSDLIGIEDNPEFDYRQQNSEYI